MYFTSYCTIGLYLGGFGLLDVLKHMWFLFTLAAAVSLQKFGMICTLWNGTLLGALKFGTELPWEVGGSVIVHSHNFSNFGSMMRPYVKSYLEHELNLVCTLHTYLLYIHTYLSYLCFST